jgi:N-acetylmuramoyl-L-alanine amidase
VAEALKKSGVTVVMSRSDDSDTELDYRSEFANDAGADIFVSLHRNSTAQANTSKGIEIWIHSSGSERSYAAADDILNNLEEVGITENRGVRIGTQGDSDSDYAVIRDTYMTSMIIEMGFMTNQEDLDMFNDNLDNYAKAISNGVVQWLNDYVQ